ncbi:hypothetical protein B4113_0889 [Geobacillus sp. B4113_201601]|nr:hypothetical protein B4113_0889 [Geobacillus sp. B4113_201601]
MTIFRRFRSFCLAGRTIAHVLFVFLLLTPSGVYLYYSRRYPIIILPFG